ncbi:hypothetical protein CLV58_11616 [Spirosoma oryzae]|uniref:Uncharacterized protein n=1 Tax=Spirosoma oryzae TaxID=1469603 RepID=A0A2T0SML5_9BACT|nr:hypothetical protein [Spirosoma oryzae]PRY34623.1 hypothetical protein CLV58_11616 [Spirosoma oryzae]
MTTVQIPITEQVAQRFQQLPRPQQQAITDKVALLLIQELNRVDVPAGTLHDFQDAMRMSDEDMRLTFGNDYLIQHNWQATDE